MTTNLFDYFEEVEEEDGAHAPWAARAPRIPNGRFDMKLVPRSPDWRDDPASLRALERIAAQPWADALVHTDDGVELRLSDAWIEGTGAALEAGGGDEAELVDLAGGGRYAVQFWDANATKALHVGHLRNLALGNSLAAALEQGGGAVERRSIISDAGRSMGEAMAGIVRSGHHAEAWPDGDRKSDHFVGLCYADYVASGGFAEEGPEEREDSLTRELRMRNDAADELLKRVLEGDPEALELWFKTRAWVIAGQRKTLARLGVAFDRVFFESDFLDDGLKLTERGLREGTLRRREDGVVVYATGVEDLEEMPLLRADGQSTQHMRAVSYWMGAPGLDGVTTLQICGTEWVSHATCIRQLMTELRRGENGAAPAGENGGRGAGAVHPTRDIFHGMVAQQKRAVSSSEEGGLLIDDLIESIEQRIDADPRRARGAPRPSRPGTDSGAGRARVLPALPGDPARGVRHREAAERAREPRLGSGARACAQGRGAGGAGTAPRRGRRLSLRGGAVGDIPPPPAPRGRALRRDSAGAVSRHLARWYMEQPRSRHTERVIHTLLDRSARGLGLEAGR